MGEALVGGLDWFAARKAKKRYFKGMSGIFSQKYGQENPHYFIY